MSVISGTVSLDEFCDDVKVWVARFSHLYREQHEKSPDQYPLEIEADNSGVWFEMFLKYIDFGNV